MHLACLIAGAAVLSAAWLGPLPTLARQAFFGHMVMHMLVVAIAAPLLAWGVAGGKLDPVRRRPALFSPILASVGELILVWAWHAPGLHHLARMHTWGLAAEQGSFLVAGLWLWLSVLGGDPQRLDSRAAAGVVGLLLTSMHMTLLGALLALAPRPVYDHHSGYGNMTALEDQHWGGAVMILIGGVVYLCGGLLLTIQLLRSRAPQQVGKK